MSSKGIVYLFASIGSILGAYIPKIWGGSLFSVLSVLFSGIGGIAGIFVGLKFTK